MLTIYVTIAVVKSAIMAFNVCYRFTIDYSLIINT